MVIRTSRRAEYVIKILCISLVLGAFSIFFGTHLSCPEQGPGMVADGCSYQGNPILWLPVGLLNFVFLSGWDFGLTYGADPSFTWNSILIFAAITFPYWILISAFMDKIVTSIKNHNRTKSSKK